MKIAIIGAGIGGLTTALCLEKFGLQSFNSQPHGLQIDIFEQSVEIKPVGAGIMLAHNAMQVYSKLGLQERIEAHGRPLAAMNIVTDKLQHISTLATAEFNQQFAVQNIAIHRGALQTVLLNAVQKSRLQLNKRLISIKDLEGGQSCLSFADGSQGQYDIVIAADGLRSVVRHILFPSSTIRSAEQTCWRGLAKMTLPKTYTKALHEAWGAGTRFGFVQISPDTVYWYALCNDNQQCATESMANLFAEYHPIIPDIIQRTATEQIHLSAIEDLQPLKSWYRGNTFLLGDAAHATTPNIGQGACQAIEDAYVLSHCLLSQSLATVGEHYQQLRMQKAQGVVDMSWRLGKVSQLENPLLIKLRNTVLRWLPPKLNQRQTEKILTLPKLVNSR